MGDGPRHRGADCRTLTGAKGAEKCFADAGQVVAAPKLCDVAMTVRWGDRGLRRQAVDSHAFTDMIGLA